MRLGVNIDHIATLRQARRENFPDPVEAAREAIVGGADGIVCHLREDRRHIQDKDVLRLKNLPTRLDLEMAATNPMLKFALKINPEMVTIVPEKRQEVTTEGGLDVKAGFKKLKSCISKLKQAGILVSLFVEPTDHAIKISRDLDADFVEIHTGKYANLKSLRELRRIKAATRTALNLGLRVNAGHGLDYTNVRQIVKIEGIDELNIGFSIISRAVFVGVKKAVKQMKGLL